MNITSLQLENEQPISLDAARELMLNISRTTLRKLIRAGKIRSHKNGRKYFFFRSELIQDLKSL